MRYDHGHVEFKDGNEVEFGFTMPMLPKDEDARSVLLWRSAVAQALAWANLDAETIGKRYIEDDIKNLRLAG